MGGHTRLCALIPEAAEAKFQMPSPATVNSGTNTANRALNGLIFQHNCQSSLCIEFVELLMPC